MDSTDQSFEEMRPMSVQPSVGPLQQSDLSSTIAEYMAYGKQNETARSPSHQEFVDLDQTGNVNAEEEELRMYNSSLSRFVQNELTDYSEFLHDNEENEALLEDDEIELYGDDDEEEHSEEDPDVPGPSHLSGKRLAKIKSKSRKISKFESETFDEDRMLGIPSELRGGGGTDSTNNRNAASRGTRRLPRTLEALLGQANVIYAQGKTDQAISMLQEVIRQEPRNAEPYRHLSDIYRDLEDVQKSIQYGLLSAHLDYRTPAADWSELGDQCARYKSMEEAAACYGRAIRADPTNWLYYEKRISTLNALGLRPLAMKSRLQAAQMVDQPSANFEWYRQLIKTVAEYYIGMNDEEKAISALEAFVARSQEYNKAAEEQHEILMGLWMSRGRYLDAAKSVFALCPGIQAADNTGKLMVEVVYSPSGYTVTQPFPPVAVAQWTISDDFRLSVLSRLIVSLIQLKRSELVKDLIIVLLVRELELDFTERLLEISSAFVTDEKLQLAQKFLEQCLEKKSLESSAVLWFAYAEVLELRNKTEPAISALRKVLQLQSDHVDGRIQLSAILQAQGAHEEALETLCGDIYDLDNCTRMPDERLLLRQAAVLLERRLIEQYVRCVRMLLAPYFYEMHRLNVGLVRRSRQIAKSLVLRDAAVEAIQGSQWERFVKRMGAIAQQQHRHMELSVQQIHDFALKLSEILYENGRFADMLHVCCYTYLQPSLAKTTSVRTFEALLFVALIRAHKWPMAFDYVRSKAAMMTDADLCNPNYSARLYSAFALVFCHSQNVRYHRYVMRALARQPTNMALTLISGNNSLIAGSYRHALCEYLRVWRNSPDNPLLSMLIGLVLVHIASKKTTNRRHMVLVRGFAFMQQYERLRGGRCQETMYNIGRMFHQLNMLPLAVHFYKLVLEETNAPMVASFDAETGQEIVTMDERYDLRSLAGYNLHLIYQNSGNPELARMILLKYCVC